MQVRPDSEEHWSRLRADIGRLVAPRLSGSADAEDVVQEVLVRVWRHGATLRDEERFGPWLSRVAHNAATDHLRFRGRLLGGTSAGEPLDLSSQDGVSDEMESVKHLIAATLRPFVELLPPPYREAITLSELEGLSHAAIAERLSVSVSGIKSRVQRGRDQLRKLLERCCEFALDARGAPVSCVVKPDGILPPGCCPAGPEDSESERAVGCVPTAERRRS